MTAITEETIGAAEMKLIEAIRNSDVTYLDKVLHDDLLCLGPDGSLITKAMDLASHRAGGMVVEKLIPHIDEIRITGDTAVVVIAYETKGVMAGTPIEGTFRYIRMWKQFPDALKVVAAACFKA